MNLFSPFRYVESILFRNIDYISSFFLLEGQDASLNEEKYNCAIAKDKERRRWSKTKIQRPKEQSTTH